MKKDKDKAERNQEQNQVAKNRSNREQIDNRGRPRNKGGNQRSIWRGNDRKRIHLKRNNSEKNYLLDIQKIISNKYW